MTAPTAADRWRTHLRPELLASRKARDTVRTSTLRTVLAAIDNAESRGTEPPGTAVSSAGADGPIAGAVSGVGSTEAARTVLDDSDIRQLVFAEIAERRTAAGQLPAEYADRIGQLLAEAQLLVEIAHRQVDCIESTS